jgi:protein O-mannosyl-transferase
MPILITDEKKEKNKNKIGFSLSVLVLSILVLVTFWKSFSNAFVDLDDYTYVVDNNLVRNTSETTIKDVFSKPGSLNYHPLTILSLRLNINKCPDCIDGISPAPFIKWNVIIHLLNTILVLLLIYQITEKNLFVSFFVAAIFGVHPMHVESVVWISERKDVLYSFFFLSGLLAYLKYLNARDKLSQKWIWLGVTFMLFIMSCLSKAMAVVFPLVLILLKFRTQNITDSKTVKESVKACLSFKTLLPLIPFLLASLFFGILAISINNHNSFTAWHRIQYASYGLVMYIVRFFVPMNQVAVYPYPTLAEYQAGGFFSLFSLAPVIVLLVSGLVIYSIKKTRLFVFGIGFFFVTIMMVLQFISVGVAIISDKYTYLPYIGLAFVPAVLIGEQIKKKRVVWYALPAGFVVIMLILSLKQISVWRNSETLWTNVINRYPNQETARSIRGIYYSKLSARAKDINEENLYDDKALADFLVAIKAETPRADVYEAAGRIYGKNGKLNNALFCFDKAIQKKPGNGSAYYNRGITFGLLKRYSEAINDYNHALLYAPQKAIEIRTSRSNIFLSLGRIKEAIADLDYLISRDNKNVVLYYNRGVARQHLNNFPGAIADFRRALEISPNDTLSTEMLQKLIGK